MDLWFDISCTHDTLVSHSFSLVELKFVSIFSFYCVILIESFSHTPCLGVALYPRFPEVCQPNMNSSKVVHMSMLPSHDIDCKGVF
jgi:hypothetical protein